jgi:hypothetical protein
MRPTRKRLDPSLTSSALIPAKAGIQSQPLTSKPYALDPRLRGDEREIGEQSGLIGARSRP